MQYIAYYKTTQQHCAIYHRIQTQHRVYTTQQQWITISENKTAIVSNMSPHQTNQTGYCFFDKPL